LALILFGSAFTLAAAYALGRLALRSLPAPGPILFATGSALLSLIVFLLLLAGIANRWVFLGVGLAILLVGRVPRPAAGPPAGFDRITKRLLIPILGVYGGFYFIHALAPEIQPDATTYHLGLVREYIRLGSFPHRIAFFEVMPQGLEMLFAFAFAFGAHSAAKLVHFAFLVATFPLMLATGRRLGLPAWVSACAAGFYLCAPVAGIDGTCAYIDCALVFFALATFYSMLAWTEARDEERDDRWLFAAGIAAGFCYALKMTGVVVPLAALAVVLISMRWRPPLIFAAATLAMAAPWVMRSAVLTGNPVAPFLNRVFTNPHFYIWTEQDYVARLRTYGGLTAWNAPLELTARGVIPQGFLGPVFLLAPLALLALRKRAGRIVLASAAILALPWFLNVGTRFLLPALPFLAFALAMSLPRRVALACLVLDAITCLPQVSDLYGARQAWKLRGLPLRAALRIEPEPDYLRHALESYPLAEMLTQRTQPGDRILDLEGAPRAYFDRETLVYWQSALANRLSYGLQFATQQHRRLLDNVRAEWPEQPLSAIRFLQTAAFPGAWGVHEVELYRGVERVPIEANWLASAVPYSSDAPLALDGNLASLWATWSAARPGMYLEIEFDRPQALTAVTLVVNHLSEDARVEFHGRGADGAWRLLSNRPAALARPEDNLRRDAARFILRSGFRYILTPTGPSGHGLTGVDLLQHEEDYAIHEAGRAGNYVLFRID
jgi:hypothetical protein